MRLRLLWAVVFAILLLAPIAFADYSDNFDSYASGVVSPSPWFQTSNAATCYAGSTETIPSAYSIPNVYEWSLTVASPCTSGNPHTDLNLRLIATSASIEVTFYFETLSSSSGSGPSFYVYLNGTQGLKIATIFGIVAWNQKVLTFPVTSGHHYNLNFSINGAISVGGQWIAIDNMVITGASVYTPGANIILNNIQTNSLFNIANYTNSYFSVAYPSTTPTVISNVKIPDFSVGITGASLLTMTVDNSFFVSLIPVAGVNNFYLLPPGQEYSYVVAVQDLSGQFGAGSQIYLNQGTRTLASGYLDAGGTFTTWAPPGSYTVKIVNGVHTYSAPLNLPATGSTSASPTVVQILKITAVGNCGVTCTVSYGARFSSNTVIFGFNDTTDTTTSVTDALYVSNSSGSFKVYTHTWSPGPYGSLIDTIPCNNDNCNASIAGSLSVHLS